jgi:hypothetical protein
MVEFEGKIEKIEKAKITNLDIVTILSEDTQIKLRLELVKKINPFKESDPVKVLLDTKANPEEKPKLILNGLIYSITKKEGAKIFDINIGGLRLRLEAPETFDDLKAKSNIFISFF